MILKKGFLQFSHSVLSDSLRPTLCDLMNCSMPGLPVHHQLPEFTQTHVHWVDDAIQPSHPLLTLLLLPSIFPSMSLFQWVRSLHHVAKVLELQLQHQSIQWIFRVDFFRNDWLDHLPCGSAGKESACNGGDLDSIPGLERSPWEGKGYPLQYSGLENSMDCIVYGVAKNQTWLLLSKGLSRVFSNTTVWKH